MYSSEINDGQAPAGAETTPPRKRQRRVVLEDTDVQPSRKGTACSICRRLKVKCDSADRGMGTCSRCLRLQLQCVSEKKVWISAESEEKNHQPSEVVLFKLERALEDVLEKLNMPALDLYAQPVISETLQSPQPTRQNSQEPVSSTGRRDERDLSPGTMGSLIEATRMNGLCSQLRSVKQRRKGGMRRMDADLIAEKLLSHKEAEEMLELFKTLLAPHLFSATISPDATLETVRTSSTILFTAIMLVSTLHIPGRESTHEICHSRFLGLISSAIFDRFHTLDDIRGLCIAAFWEPDLSWKLSGISIRMATELNLHHAFYEVFYTPDISEDARRDSLEKARLWYLLFVLDHQSSIAYGRPPVMAELRPIKDFEVLLNSPLCTPPDRVLIAQVTCLANMSKAFQAFGLEPKRIMGGDDASVLNHSRFTEDARAWQDRWRHLREMDMLGGGVDLHYYFSELVLHSLVLRGRPLDNLCDLPTSLRPLTLRAIEAAHSLLQHFIEDPGYREGIVGMPLYLHSMIAFAVVFLMKMSHRWYFIGITIDPAQRTRPLIEGIIKLLRGCKAGANHMVFSMANGFERMLKQASSTARKAHVTESSNAYQQGPTWIDLQGASMNGQSSGPTNYSLEQSLNPKAHAEPNYVDSVQLTPDVSPYNNWGFQDEEMWNLGMGYDLLAPGGEGLANADFPFHT
ncbi:hypothetical protein N7474_004166 [Penicillium riverlandense]|uniref:uncharacterized protein n=1 Tax=Penicillium riverlandense TaxID=1903569 RepID=UPI0025499EBA|nr:uncharacterized protein N7474_004166 [Penicillium riverlandense]KAJ5818575.1 hypothetical protein N7474_004166 [Penicillium riverlandense]